MRIAIISDIHSNLEALQTALHAIGKEKVDETICLGDIVGYGANPNECIDLIREITPHVLLGNHDEAAFDLSRTEFFNPFARIAAEWTNEELTDDRMDYLQGNLPPSYSQGQHSWIPRAISQLKLTSLL